MNGKNKMGYNDAVARTEFVARMFATLFSDAELSQEEHNDLCRYLFDCDPVLRDVAMDIYFASLPEHNGLASDAESALIASKWTEIAPVLGMNPDMEYYNSIRRARAANPGTRSRGKVVRLRFRHTALRVAAVLIPVVLVISGYFGWGRYAKKRDGVQTPVATFTPSQIVEPLADSVRRITLVDGTKVTLNLGATFAYNDNREVELRGEAFFEVAKNPEKPFVIHSEYLTVTVLGTEFCFDTNGEDGLSQLALYDGQVELAYATGTQRLDVAGKKFTLDVATQAVAIEDFDTTSKPRWVDEAESPFNIMPLGDIFDMIESACGIEIAGRENIDMSRYYNFTVDTTISVEAVMSSLEFLHGGFKYTIDGNTVVLYKK